MAKNNLKYQSPGINEETRFEKLHTVTFENSNEASILIAREICDLIKSKQEKKKNCVIGFATGSSPTKVYQEIIRIHKEESLSFYNVIAFNLDEYYPIEKDDNNSYHHFMNENLFDHIDIPKENINIPSGEISEKEIKKFCSSYEKKIDKNGGIDIQLLGIGRTGHIGFNEPGSHFNSITRLITLDHTTRFDASKSFNGIENVPSKALTMGIRTIFNSKRIIMMAWGIQKSHIVKKSVENNITSLIPTTYLQNHKNTTLVLDKECSSELTRFKTPWLVGPCDWSDVMKRKAIVWLCEITEKSILKLTDEDYNKNGLSDLLALEGSSYELNIKMFNHFQNTISGWPGGKPNSDDSTRPERKNPNPKRVIIFSPHPDDDVISMGGTFDRLVSQGHEVHIAYQASGNVAVSDHDALKFIEVSSDMFAGDSNSKIKSLIKELKNKKPDKIDSPEVRQLKGFIRKREAIAATRYIGIPDSNTHFMNLPFYETGRIKKNPPSKKDILMTASLINKIKPHQIYAAGDLEDPHGTHKVCLDIVFEALESLKGEKFIKDCWLWLYRGAWLEWDIHEIDMAVPMSPAQVLRKRKAIFFHQTQKDGVMFQGQDLREFWVRAEERNNETAEKYKKMGLAEYAAIESFKRHYY
ncbi:MAG: glucosamine-6-phosphate deaminase [Candidatus Marisimplicoccus sp.]|nr:glucosamine-6-phosphate deaminase [Flavobacteriaceae bacterium]MAV22303.1 glucosamine-6-phosphate deaminase [Flavobacteriaceae bacterium]RZO99646.1 MAG: glucosamine-6-phosphate deaminase [Flavobacteriales bacterium]